MVGWVRVVFLTRAWLRAALLLLTEKGITVACFGHGRPATSGFFFLLSQGSEIIQPEWLQTKFYGFQTLSLLASHGFIRPSTCYIRTHVLLFAWIQDTVFLAGIAEAIVDNGR